MYAGSPGLPQRGGNVHNHACAQRLVGSLLTQGALSACCLPIARGAAVVYIPGGWRTAERIPLERSTDLEAVGTSRGVLLPWRHETWMPERPGLGAAAQTPLLVVPRDATMFPGRSLRWAG
jgi:hypothetical protein